MKHLFILTVAFLFSCNNQENTKGSNVKRFEGNLELTPTFEHLHFNDKVATVIENFLAEDTCKECLHEMYIDKVRPNYVVIVIRSRPYSSDYLKTVNPLFITKVAGTNFSVFTGLEDIISGDKLKAFPAEDSTNNNFKVWSIYVEADSVRIEKDTGMPFFPSSSPNIKPKRFKKSLCFNHVI